MLPEDYLKARVAGDLRQRWQQQRLTGRDVVMVAENRGTVIGFIAVWCENDPFIDNFHMLPSFRGRGIGSALFRQAFITLLDRGYNSAHLWVFEDNKRAIDFYSKMGGTVTAKQNKEFFGNWVSNLKIEWKNLNTAVSPL